MKNKFVACLAIAGSTLITPSVVWAAPLNLTSGDKIKLEWTNDSYGHGNGGGEFRASGVSVLNGVGDSFLTFCLEYSEHISLNTAYYVDINTKTINGGNGVAATYSGDIAGVANAYDPLSPATAWLYTQFRNGTLHSNVTGGFNYTSNADANSLQKAIWFLENEQPITFLNGDTKANYLVTAAVAAGWTGIGDVRVMNLWDSYNANTGVFSGGHQDQLYLLPVVPEPETYAMMLAGLGVLGLIVGRRNRRPA